MKNARMPDMLVVAVVSLCVLLAVILIGLLLKLRKMKAEKSGREEMMRKYMAGIDSLYDYLIRRGRLSPGKTRVADIVLEQKISAIRKQMEELIDSGGGDVPQVAVGAAVPEGSMPGVYIKAEITLSAGPRKDSRGQDTELGEDVAGTLSLPGQTFFWLLDGTSDSAAIQEEGAHIFSSRLLAQNIGYFIQRNIYRYSESLEQLVADAADAIRQEWIKRINQATPDKKAAIVRLFEQGFRPLCSTTLLVGKFLDSGRLEALRIGDSKLFPFLRGGGGELEMAREYPFGKDPTNESDRIAFMLDYSKEDGQFSIRCNTPRNLLAGCDGVVSVFVFSDGIGRVTEMQLASNNPGIVEMIRHNIGHIPQKTYDDKSLIVLERIINS